MAARARTDDQRDHRVIRRVLRNMGWAFVAALGLLVTVIAVVVVDGWKSFGRGADGGRRARIQASLQWSQGHFENPQPLWNDYGAMVSGMFTASDHCVPDEPRALPRANPRSLRQPPATGLRVTWLGHSSLLIEIDGHRVLTDPVWGERASPLGWLGPRRWYDPPIALHELPPFDAVLISHDHYNHLDHPTIVAMKG
jgi:hypothetical protein